MLQAFSLYNLSMVIYIRVSFLQKLIDKYFDMGFLLTPQAIEFLSKTHDEFDIASKDFIIDANNFIVQDTVKIIKNFHVKKDEVTTEDFVKFYTSKYEKMKNIIVSRIPKSFISLNKTDAMRNEVFIIGIVREIKADGEKKILDLEDMTMNIPVIFETPVEGVEVDDVIAVRAISGGKVLFGKDVMFPDIPIRQPATGRGKAIFVSDLHLNEAPENDTERFFSWLERSEIKNIFIAGDVGDKKAFESFAGRNHGKNFFVIPGESDGADYPQLPLQFTEKNITSLSNPSMIEINGVKVLMVHRAEQTMLKKRYIGKSSAIMPDDYLVMNDVPDIVHFGHTHVPQITNYKSVTMVNSGSVMSEFKPVIVDFSSRSAEFARVE